VTDHETSVARKVDVLMSTIEQYAVGIKNRLDLVLQRLDEIEQRTRDGGPNAS